MEIGLPKDYKLGLRNGLTYVYIDNHQCNNISCASFTKTNGTFDIQVPYDWLKAFEQEDVSLVQQWLDFINETLGTSITLIDTEFSLDVLNFKTVQDHGEYYASYFPDNYKDPHGIIKHSRVLNNKFYIFRFPRNDHKTTQYFAYVLLRFLGNHANHDIIQTTFDILPHVSSNLTAILLAYASKEREGCYGLYCNAFHEISYQSIPDLINPSYNEKQYELHDTFKTRKILKANYKKIFNLLQKKNYTNIENKIKDIYETDRKL